MNYGLSIKEHNIKAHCDIEHDIQQKQNGLFTVIIRCNDSNIVDVVLMEYVGFKDYYALKSVTLEEHTIAYNNRIRSEQNAVRPNNS